MALRGYTGLAAKGYVHRLVDHSKNEYSDRKGNYLELLCTYRAFALFILNPFQKGLKQ